MSCFIWVLALAGQLFFLEKLVSVVQAWQLQYHGSQNLQDMHWVPSFAGLAMLTDVGWSAGKHSIRRLILSIRPERPESSHF